MEKDRINEVKCLTLVRDSFCGNGKLNKLFDNSDFSKVISILKSTHPNKNHSKFPDFFFDGGIIEHFEVTASIEKNKKGSLHRINDANCEREIEKHFKQLDKEFIENPHHPGTMKTETFEATHDYFTYELFVKSFKRNTEHHLKSLRESEYLNQVVVFLIELTSPDLCIYVNNQFNRFYKLSEDKKLLQYIKESLKDVNYIIFKTTGDYEIIDLFKIDSVIDKAKDNLDIRGGREKNTFIKLYFDY